MNPHNIHLFMKNSLLLPGAFLLLGIVGCEKDAGPLTTNSVIHGHADLFSFIHDEPVNIRVTASGPYGHKSADVDPSGTFLIDGLGNGTYYLDYSQEGYGTLREFGIQLFGGDTVWVNGATLFKLPQEVLPKFTKVYTGIREQYDPNKILVCIETNISQIAGSYPDVMIFMNTNPDVAWNRYECYYPSMNAGFNSVNVYTIYIDPDALPFKSGSKVYLKGYPCNVLEYNFGFLDTYRGERMFSTLDKSKTTDVLFFIMP
jgi:hypothetical protein